MINEEILQLVPSGSNWWAWYVDPDSDGGGFWTPIAAWALVEADSEVRTGEKLRFIVGVDPTGGGWEGWPINQTVEYFYLPDGPPPGWQPQLPGQSADPS